MKLFYKPIALPFEYPFTISGGRTKTHQPALLVALQLGNYIGYGEAPAIQYYNVTIDEMVAVLEQKRIFVEKFALTEPERYWHYLHHLLPNHPFLVAALDMAAWDLFGKMEQQPIYKIWGLNFQNTPLTNYTIGIDSEEKMIQKMLAKPWPIYKIKLGFENDVALVAALRNKTNAIIRVDANAGWTLEEALIKIPELQKLGVEFVEQPLEKENWEEMRVLFQQSSLPLIADESCVSEHDVAKCKDHFHGINIKLTKCSGLTPAKRMISEARKLGLKVMMGSMNESTVGSAAIAQFLPLLDYVDMDGPLLLKEDIATGLEFDEGKVQIIGNTGLGIEMKQ